MLGVLPGVIGLLQATEAIKLMLGIGDAADRHACCISMRLALRFRETRLRRRSGVRGLRAGRGVPGLYRLRGLLRRRRGLAARSRSLSPTSGVASMGAAVTLSRSGRRPADPGLPNGSLPAAAPVVPVRSARTRGGSMPVAARAEAARPMSRRGSQPMPARRTRSGSALHRCRRPPRRHCACTRPKPACSPTACRPGGGWRRTGPTAACCRRPTARAGASECAYANDRGIYAYAVVPRLHRRHALVGGIRVVGDAARRTTRIQRFAQPRQLRARRLPATRKTMPTRSRTRAAVGRCAATCCATCAWLRACTDSATSRRC